MPAAQQSGSGVSAGRYRQIGRGNHWQWSWSGEASLRRPPGIARPALGVSTQSEHITKLYRSYFDRAAGSALPRPRGRSPRRAAFFLRNPRLKQEAALIASLCVLLGALPRRAARAGLPVAAASLPALAQGVPQGVALCEAYEAYRALVPAARISFEHLVYLFTALNRGDELRLASCAGCGAVLVAERTALKEARCLYCADLAAE